MADDDACPPAAEAILSLLAAREPGKSVCPSEAARRLDNVDWRGRMDEVRAAAAALVRDGVLDVTQKGEVVDIASARGPIRLRLRSST